VGARPNFVKIAPIMGAMAKHVKLLEPILIHTGQHYDPSLSDVFFMQLAIPRPSYKLGVGPGTPVQQTAEIMVRFDALCSQEDFDRVLLVGDVTSTLACAITAARNGIPVDHVEAGLRSFDRSMPEEINRIVTDSLADLCFVTEPSGVKNLLMEGHSRARVKHVGNVMIDSLLSHLDAAKALEHWRDFGFTRKEYGVVTLHRPSNVDDLRQFNSLLELLRQLSMQLPLVFPVHPRTRLQLDEDKHVGDIAYCQPLRYLEFLSLLEGALVVLTDSGGVQEETTVLGVPCLTLRDSTERPITVEIGTNTLIRGELERVLPLVADVMNGSYKSGEVPPLWDGRSSERIVSILLEEADG
jgi:UDP-N-acetylglucosamine 2-epimerase (non-hydrolysing)